MFFYDMNMDKDRVVGSATVVEGKMNEAVGKAVGDVKLESEVQGRQDRGRGSERCRRLERRDRRGIGLAARGVAKSARSSCNPETAQLPECSPLDSGRERGHS